MKGLILVLILVLVVLYLRKKKKASAPAPAVVEPEENANTENIKVAGISYRLDDVLSLGSENADYSLSKAQIQKDHADESINKWTFPVYPARFEYEPENEHDPNAIAIYVNDIKIGYVKKGSTSHIRNLIEGGSIEKLTCKFSGGPYKLYDSAMEEFIDESPEISAKVTIYKKL